MGFPINPPRTPMLLPDGNLRPEWWKFFLAIQQMVGGATNPFDDTALLAVPLQPTGAVVDSGIIAFLASPPPGQAAQPTDFLMPYPAPASAGTSARFTSTTDGVVPLSGGGTANYMRADGTWAAPPGAAGGYTVASTAVSYAETATSGEKVVLVTATGQTVTLPTAVGNTAKFNFKLMVAGTVIVDGAGTETIDGGLTATLVTQYEAMCIVSDNANWVVL